MSSTIKVYSLTMVDSQIIISGVLTFLRFIPYIPVSK